MGIFTNYDNLDKNYIPNNVSPQCYDDIIEEDVLPRPFYNLKGNFVGYTWNQDDTFKWEIDLNKEILVESNALIYDVKDVKPTETTQGSIGQKAYNVIDIKSWLCVGFTEETYIWKEDESFTYPQNGDKKIILKPIVLGNLSLDLYDFRWEHINTFSNFNGNKLLVEFDKSINELISQGIYYGILKNTNDADTKTINKYLFFVQ